MEINCLYCGRLLSITLKEQGELFCDDSCKREFHKREFSRQIIVPDPPYYDQKTIEMFDEVFDAIRDAWARVYNADTETHTDKETK